MKWDDAQIRLALRCYVILNVGTLGREGTIDLAHQVVNSGATIIQLRDKHGSDESLSELSKEILPDLPRCLSSLGVKRPLALVQATGLDGVHLGAEDGDIKQVRAALGPDDLSVAASIVPRTAKMGRTTLA